MRINLNPKRGGVKIKGDAHELVSLANVLLEAALEGDCEGAMLTEEGVETVFVKRQGPPIGDDA